MELEPKSDTTPTPTSTSLQSADSVFPLSDRGSWKLRDPDLLVPTVYVNDED